MYVPFPKIPPVNTSTTPLVVWALKLVRPEVKFGLLTPIMVSAVPSGSESLVSRLPKTSKLTCVMLMSGSASTIFTVIVEVATILLLPAVSVSVNSSVRSPASGEPKELSYNILCTSASASACAKGPGVPATVSTLLTSVKVPDTLS